MVETADVVVVGAGVQGASVAFHLARRGARVVVLERSTIAGGATGRSSGLVRMHYAYESEARLAFASLPCFRDWADVVGAGDCGFVRTGFLQLVPLEHADLLRGNVDMLRRIGVDTRVVGPDEAAGLFPGLGVDDVVAAAYEPESGYADPPGTAAGFLAAARERGARLVQGCRVTAIRTSGGKVVGVDSDRASIDAPVVVDAAGAWAGEVAALAGVDVPVRAWRHDTAYFGLPTGRATGFPVVIDNANEVYFRPEGKELMLVGLEAGNEIGGSPDRPERGLSEDVLEQMVTRVCARVPWMADGELRTSHGGQDGISPDEHSIIGLAGPDGFVLDCGHSGTGFKTAPAVGAAVSELILDGVATTADLSDFRPSRFAEGWTAVAEHDYGRLWR
jgi:sarcosine oxidase, subunit beta